MVLFLLLVSGKFPNYLISAVVQHIKSIEVLITHDAVEMIAPVLAPCNLRY